MNFKPLGLRVLVEREVESTTTTSGIIIPDSATEKPSMGKITAVGNGKLNDKGVAMPLDVKVGDSVLFGKFSGTEIKLDGEELLVMREDDIMAVI